MLDPQSWLPQAQELALGQKRRVDHDCGDGRTMIVDHKSEGWSAWCYRCSDIGFKSHPQLSLADRLARLAEVKAVEEDVQRDTRPPIPANFDPSSWPLEARVWLYKAGFSNDTIRKHGFYHCGRLGRVVMPVLDQGKVVYWQARGFDKSRAKYINPPVDRSALAPLYEPDCGKLSQVVLTEDILSAIRVAGGAGVHAAGCSLMGTAISDKVLLMVVAHRLPVAVWLDPDGAGQRAAPKIANKLRTFGVATRIIRTPRDPKFYSNEEIARLVST